MNKPKVYGRKSVAPILKAYAHWIIAIILGFEAALYLVKKLGCELPDINILDLVDLIVSDFGGWAAFVPIAIGVYEVFRPRKEN